MKRSISETLGSQRVRKNVIDGASECKTFLKFISEFSVYDTMSNNTKEGKKM